MQLTSEIHNGTLLCSNDFLRITHFPVSADDIIMEQINDKNNHIHFIPWNKYDWQKVQKNLDKGRVAIWRLQKA